jgi:hypothetical protein
LNNKGEDNTNLAETSNLLLAKLSKESIRTLIEKIKDPRIELIRKLAEVKRITRNLELIQTLFSKNKKK